MSRPSSPTVWRRWMAFELKRMRQETGLSQADVAQVLGCKVPKVSLTESGQRNVQEDDLRKLLDLYEVPEDRRPDYLEAARNMRKRGWWERLGQHTLRSFFMLYVGLEQGAERVRTYEPAIIPGLLQIREYAAVTVSRGVAGTSPEKVQRAVELRMQRQQALWRDTDPLRLSVVMDEAALRRVVGDRHIMRAQLLHVAEVAVKHEDITVQVVPFERGAYDATYGPFVILSFPWSREPGVPYDPGVVYVELRSHAELLEGLPEIDLHSQVFQQLCTHALEPGDSIALIRNVAEEYK